MSATSDGNNDVLRTGPEEAKKQYADDLVRRYEALGWSRNGRNELVDPQDPDITMWRDPYTHEILFSPKFIEQLNKIHQDMSQT